MLRCTGITKEFGGVHALEDVDLHVEPGEMLGLIGPNGSGKSTFVNVVSGFLVPERGEVLLDDQVLTGHGAGYVRRAGVARTFQNLRLIDRLTVLENVLIGLHLHYTNNRAAYWHWIPAVLGTPAARRRDRSARAMAQEALDHLGLGDKLAQSVGDLSYGDRKRVELARLIALKPKVLLLDEPTAGLEPSEADSLMETVVGLVAASPERHVLLIEHRLDLVLDLCDRVAVFDSGRKVADGKPQVVANDPEVIRIYIGEPEAA
jgi:ABC-type branched-subunit amino acid transport system ATPase component